MENGIPSGSSASSHIICRTREDSQSRVSREAPAGSFARRYPSEPTATARRRRRGEGAASSVSVSVEAARLTRLTRRDGGAVGGESSVDALATATRLTRRDIGADAFSGAAVSEAFVAASSRGIFALFPAAGDDRASDIGSILVGGRFCSLGFGFGFARVAGVAADVLYPRAAAGSPGLNLTLPPSFAPSALAFPAAPRTTLLSISFLSFAAATFPRSPDASSISAGR
jgi:hypothetical protein